MNETLIKNWNETVPEEGTVFFLGDFCMKGSTFWKSILERLNGKIYFIIGNHDIGRIKESFAGRFEAMAEQMKGNNALKNEVIQFDFDPLRGY